MNAVITTANGRHDENEGRIAETTGLPANLPDVATARLPATYEAAQKAIAACESVDECKNWSDKAEAIASYARQAKNDSLRVMAVRIQARAERRLGELLKQYPNASAQNLVQHRREGDHPSVTRTQVASNAGLSEHQRKTAMRIASVPEEEFNRQIESSMPPTITRLAEQGKGARNSIVIDVADHGDLVSEARDALVGFARFCETHEPAELARMFEAHEASSLRRCVATVDRWLDQFVTGLAG